MNEQLRLLVELQKLDTSIISLSKTIKSIPGRISAMEKPLADARDNLQARKQRFEAAEKKKRDMERSVEEVNEKISKMKARTDIKDNKSYQAHLKEIEQAEKQRFEMEDQVLELMEGIEEEAGKMKAAESALAVQTGKAEEMKKALDLEVGEAEAELHGLKASRSEIVKSVEKDVYDRYMTLLTSLGGLAVTKAADEVCTGCNMHIMPQLYVEIKKNEELISCPQCRRILYFVHQEG